MKKILIGIFIVLVIASLAFQQVQILKITSALSVNNLTSSQMSSLLKLHSDMLIDMATGQIATVDSLNKIIDYIVKNVDRKPNQLKIRLACVEIKVGRWGGAGTIIKVDKDYLYILTAKHVVNCEGEITIQVTDKQTKRFVRIQNVSRDNVYKSVKLDMALIKAPRPQGNFEYLKLATKTPIIGTKIYTIGHPISLPYTVNVGIVSNYTERCFGENREIYMMISAPCFSGNSGGASFNCAEELVGIVVGIAYVRQDAGLKSIPFYLTHLSFAVKLNDIRNFLETLNITI